jgi:hypothetical protein
MLDFITNAGLFGVLSVVLGTAGLALAAVDAVRGAGRYPRAIAALAAAALAVGLLGTGVGLRQAAIAIEGAADLDAAAIGALWRRATAIAWSATSVGAGAAALDLLAIAAIAVFRPSDGAR